MTQYLPLTDQEEDPLVVADWVRDMSCVKWCLHSDWARVSDLIWPDRLRQIPFYVWDSEHG